MFSFIFSRFCSDISNVVAPRLPRRRGIGKAPNFAIGLTAYSRYSDLIRRGAHNDLSKIDFLNFLLELALGGWTNNMSILASNKLEDAGRHVKDYLSCISRQLSNTRVVEARCEATLCLFSEGRQPDDWESGVDDIFSKIVHPSKLRSVETAYLKEFHSAHVEIIWLLLQKLGNDTINIGSLRAEFGLGMGYDRIHFFRVLTSVAYLEQTFTTTFPFSTLRGVPALVNRFTRTLGWENPMEAIVSIASKWSDVELARYISHNKLLTDKCITKVGMNF